MKLNFFIFLFFKERGEKLANTQNSGNGPDRSYCYEISLFHGQDCYISLGSASCVFSGSFSSTQGAGQKGTKLQEGSDLNKQQGSVQSEAQKLYPMDSHSCLGMGDTLSVVLCWS